jgi:hypothetical protein
MLRTASTMGSMPAQKRPNFLIVVVDDLGLCKSEYLMYKALKYPRIQRYLAFWW